MNKIKTTIVILITAFMTVTNCHAELGKLIAKDSVKLGMSVCVDTQLYNHPFYISKAEKIDNDRLNIRRHNIQRYEGYRSHVGYYELYKNSYKDFTLILHKCEGVDTFYIEKHQTSFEISCKSYMSGKLKYPQKYIEYADRFWSTYDSVRATFKEVSCRPYDITCQIDEARTISDPKYKQLRDSARLVITAVSNTAKLDVAFDYIINEHTIMAYRLRNDMDALRAKSREPWLKPDSLKHQFDFFDENEDTCYPYPLERYKSWDNIVYITPMLFGVELHAGECYDETGVSCYSKYTIPEEVAKAHRVNQDLFQWGTSSIFIGLPMPLFTVVKMLYPLTHEFFIDTETGESFPEDKIPMSVGAD